MTQHQGALLFLGFVPVITIVLRLAYEHHLQRQMLTDWSHPSKRAAINMQRSFASWLAILVMLVSTALLAANAAGWVRF